MSYKIRKFNTISLHQAKLSQPPSVIVSLVSVLKYIRKVLDDDQTQTLFQMIEHHLTTKDLTAHHLNLKELSTDIFNVLVESFKGIAESINQLDNAPATPESFYSWLLSNREIYDGEDLPDDYDAFNSILTLRLVIWWMSEHHDRLVTSHPGTLVPKVDKIFAPTISPVKSISPELSDLHPYALMSESSYDKLINIQNQRLIEFPPMDSIIDYLTYDDISFDRLENQTEEDLALMSVFMEQIYTEIEGVAILQFDQVLIQAIKVLGSDIMLDYVNSLADYGETESNIYRWKYLDYYKNHLDFVLSSSMDQNYRDLLTNIRSNVNPSYAKVFYVPTIINRREYSIEIGGYVGKLTSDKTLDLLNLVGLSKSIVAISLEPYTSEGKLYNRIIASFDNYNPDFTGILKDGITEEFPVIFDLLITINHEQLVASIVVGNQQFELVFSNTNRKFKVDPYYLFIPPRIEHADLGRTRITKLKIYGRFFEEQSRTYLTT